MKVESINVFCHHTYSEWEFRGILTFQCWLTGTNHITGNDFSKVSLHNKPKKASSTGIVRQGKLNICQFLTIKKIQQINPLLCIWLCTDYICTQYDHQIITPVKNMPLSRKETIVHIGNNDAIIDRKFLDCRFQNSGTSTYLNDEVRTVITSLLSWWNVKFFYYDPSIFCFTF
jgi:hypothetical protein